MSAIFGNAISGLFAIPPESGIHHLVWFRFARFGPNPQGVLELFHNIRNLRERLLVAAMREVVLGRPLCKICYRI